MTLTDQILGVIGNQHVLGYEDGLRDYHVAQAVKRAMRLKVKSHRYTHIGRILHSYRVIVVMQGDKTRIFAQDTQAEIIL